MNAPCDPAPSSIQTVFGDNTLAYDCQSCEGKCCRYHGDFHLSGKHDLIRFENHPTPTPYLFLNSYNESATITGESLSPRCWYLRDDHHCDLEIQGGIDAKPLNCILFPVNQILGINNNIYVNVSFACPLGLANHAKPSSHVISHQEVQENIDLIALRSGGLKDYGVPQITIDTNKEQQIKNLIQDLQSISADDNKSWQHYANALSDTLNKHCQSPIIDPNIIQQLFCRTYNFYPKDTWQANHLINESMVALFPSLVFRFVVQEGLLNDKDANMAFLSAQALIKICALRFAAEVALSQGHHFNGISTLSQLANKTYLKTIWLLAFGMRFTQNQQIKLEVPQHLQACANDFFNSVSQREDLSIAKHLAAIEIAPHLSNALLEVILRHQQYFQFFWPTHSGTHSGNSTTTTHA